MAGLAIATLTLAGLAAGCAGTGPAVPAAEETASPAPIPAATLNAFRIGSRIETKAQAVVAARAGLGTTRLRFAAEPTVLSAEEMTATEARRRVPQAAVYVGDSNPDDIWVWLVVFEGEWQVIPPDPMHTITPPPPAHGCTFVVLLASDGASSDIGGIDCPA